MVSTEPGADFVHGLRGPGASLSAMALFHWLTPAFGEAVLVLVAEAGPAVVAVFVQPDAVRAGLRMTRFIVVGDPLRAPPEYRGTGSRLRSPWTVRRLGSTTRPLLAVGCAGLAAVVQPERIGVERDQRPASLVGLDRLAERRQSAEPRVVAVVVARLVVPHRLAGDRVLDEVGLPAA